MKIQITYSLEEAIFELQALHKKNYPSNDVDVTINIPNGSEEVSSNNYKLLYPRAYDLLINNGYSGDNAYILINTARRVMHSGKIPAIKEVREASRGMNHLSIMGLAEAKYFVEAMLK